MENSAVELLERRIMNTSITSNGQMIFYHAELKRWLDEAKSIEKEHSEGICVNVIEIILDKLEKGKEINSKEIFEQCYNETFKSE